MMVFFYSILSSLIFYVAVVYMSYVSSFILYKGIRYRLIMPTIKSALFILFCYTSIISDVVLFVMSKHLHLLIKNTTLLLLVIVSVAVAKVWKGDFIL